MVLDPSIEGQAVGGPAGLGRLAAFLRRRLFNCDQPSRKPLDNQEANRTVNQGCISCGTCSYPELTEDHVLTSAYVKIFRIVTRNAVNKSF